MSEAAALLAEGTSFLNPKENGVFLGIEKVPGVANFEFTPETNIKEQTTKDKGQYGQVIASVPLPGKQNLKITISQVTGRVLAFALLGTLSAHSVGGGSVTDENLTSNLGRFVPLANKNITAASVVVTSNPAGTTYVEGTDYAVNYSLGLIEFLSTGSIPDATSVLIDYSHGAISGNKIEAGTKYEVRGAWKLDGRNLATGKALQVEIDEAVLVTDGSVDLMTDEFVNVTLTGHMVTQTGKTSPYTVYHELTES